MDVAELQEMYLALLQQDKFCEFNLDFFHQVTRLILMHQSSDTDNMDDADESAGEEVALNEIIDDFFNPQDDFDVVLPRNR